MRTEDFTVATSADQEFNFAIVTNTTDNMEGGSSSPVCFLCADDLTYDSLLDKLSVPTMTPSFDDKMLPDFPCPFPVYTPCFEFDDDGPIYALTTEVSRPHSPPQSSSLSVSTLGDTFSDCSSVALSGYSPPTTTQIHFAQLGNPTDVPVTLSATTSESTTEALRTGHPRVVDCALDSPSPSLAATPYSTPSAHDFNPTTEGSPRIVGLLSSSTEQTVLAEFVCKEKSPHWPTDRTSIRNSSRRDESVSGTLERNVKRTANAIPVSHDYASSTASSRGPASATRLSPAETSSARYAVASPSSATTGKRKRSEKATACQQSVPSKPGKKARKGPAQRRHGCNLCGKTFSRLGDLLRHEKTTLAHQLPVICPRCDTPLSPRKDGIKRHDELCIREHPREGVYKKLYSVSAHSLK
ncbi:hypothetical protein LshimejAT787_0506120 [Lyophyllum shimeji]|uniref:C2H2-type domain-containing protein n=1 Tax=Lyophyllum shimeji TaxID=47721 RepID=A0A9P3PNX1_LYOSH|nr:hypothetical protein LshimejAT787_0506120 [Lyophyllum shimeji]